MRILQIVADGRPGGGTTMVKTLCEALAAAGHEVHLVSQIDSYALRSATVTGRHGADFWTRRLSGATWRRLGEIVRAVEPDIVHAHGARAGLPLSFLRGTGRRLVYTVHGFHFPNKVFGARHLAVLAERHIARTAASTVFVSECDRAVASVWGFLAAARVSHVIPNGIDLARLPAPAAPDLRLIGFLGRLSYPKNPGMAIEIAARLKDRGYRLLMIGGGEMESDLRAMIGRYGLQSAVDMAGEMPHETALERLRGVGVLVNPSLWEGLPLAPLEAMGMSIPVVAASVGGTPEIVRHGETGLLVTDQDPASYAAAIERVTTDREFRTRVVAAARQRVASEFSSTAMVDSYLALYRRHISVAGSARSRL